MAVVVVGGHSRNIGKTSVVAGLIAALPEMRWTGIKITQFGHGVCSAHGRSCGCETADHAVAVSEERGDHPGTDSGRFLAAGAARSLWVRTRQGDLFEAMPRLRQEIAKSENVILESNSILQFLHPDVYLSVFDPEVVDFKPSSRRFLDRADAILCCSAAAYGRAVPRSAAGLPGVAGGRPWFPIAPPSYLTAQVVTFVAERLLAAPAGPAA